MRAVLLSLLFVLVGAGIAAAAPKFANQTIMTFSPGHGTQVEYYDATGGTYLWYPGNRSVVPGRWKTEGSQVCFSYSGNSYNPVTGHRGSGWECMPFKLQTVTIVEQARGDIFGLSKRTKVPFVLSPMRATLAGLAKGGKSEGLSSTGLTPQQQCEAIIANTNSSRAAMIQAAILYYRGMRMGEQCIKVDYLRAFALLRQAKDGRTFASLLKDLKLKAASGNPRAAAALQRLDTSPVSR